MCSTPTVYRPLAYKALSAWNTVLSPIQCTHVLVAIVSINFSSDCPCSLISVLFCSFCSTLTQTSKVATYFPWFEQIPLIWGFHKDLGWWEWQQCIVEAQPKRRKTYVRNSCLYILWWLLLLAISHWLTILCRPESVGLSSISHPQPPPRLLSSMSLFLFSCSFLLLSPLASIP